MYRLLFVGMILPALLLAGYTQPLIVLPEEKAPVVTGPALKEPGQYSFPPEGEICLLGTLDTVGGTTYDWQANGPALRMLVNSPGHGVHVLWMYSASTSGTTFPDRNMRYNYYDYTTRSWLWVDPDFMQSGVNVYTYRTGFGSLSARPSDGAAVISAHHATSSIAPVLARDVEAGAGIFDYLPGEPTIDGYQWPYVSVGSQEYYQLAMIEGATQDSLYYSRSPNFVNWVQAQPIPSPKPDAMFPTHQIAASLVPGSQKVVITWVATGSTPYTGHYRLSTDGGVNWQAPQDLPHPPAYGGDTVTSYHITSLFPMFDRNDRLHVVANVMPYVGGNGYIIPAQLWHWCPENTPNWSRIAIATCDPNNLRAAVGYNAMYACRPSMGVDGNGNLFVAWEQFDSANVEPGPPERLRADIFVASSSNNGQSWTAPQKLTNAGTSSCRFPSILDNIADTVMVAYMIDLKAGFFLYGENVATNNPIVVQKWPNPYVGGVSGEKHFRPAHAGISVSPNPFARDVHITYEVPRRSKATIEVYDPVGRLVRVIVAGQQDPGRFSAVWNGCDDAGNRVSPGVYFYRYSLDKERLTGKLMLID